LLRVIDVGAIDDRAQMVDPLDWQFRKAEAESYLQTRADELQRTGLNVKVELREGKAAENVVDYAQDSGVELIILSSHGQSGLSGWNVSGAVQKIIQRARTSVMIVRAYQPAYPEIDSLRYQRIMVPLDGSQRAEAVLPVANNLARLHEAEILAVHVVRQPEIPRRTPPTPEDIELVQRITERNRVEAEHYFEELDNRIDARLETRLMVGDSVPGLLESVVEEENVDLVLLSAHGYTGESRWPYGSTVISFIAYGIAPLLIVQDLPRDQLEPSQAEMAAKEYGGR